MRDRTRMALRASSAIAGAALVFTAGVLVARAKPGGATVSKLSFAGNVQPVPTAGTAVSFAFANTDDGTNCTASAGTPTFDANGNFVAQVDLSSCTSFSFNGGAVTYSVSVGGVTIGSPQPVNPVPYAKYSDVASAAADGGAIQTAIADLQMHVASLTAATNPNAPCPPGYTQEADAGSFTICQSAGDEVVLVGTGASRFWMDRYEASIWDSLGGQYGAISSDSSSPSYPGTFPPSGQHVAGFVPLYAWSKAYVYPSGNMTWFQAMESCAASGKRLPTGEEWMRAGSGTVDPGSNDGLSNAACNTNGSGPRQAGQGAACQSAWGVQDMIGNMVELTGEWVLGAGLSGTDAGPTFASGGASVANWPWGIDDVTGNLSTAVQNVALSGPVAGLPAVASRGGSWADQTRAGLFAISTFPSPALVAPWDGFRCVIPGR